MKTEVLSEPVLVGRERELQQLTDFLTSAAEGRGATVFVTGEAGTGKTSLINKFLKAARQKMEVAILCGGCISNAAAPYLPFIEASTRTFPKKKIIKPKTTQKKLTHG